jgi:hypothetical protein
MLLSIGVVSVMASSGLGQTATPAPFTLEIAAIGSTVKAGSNIYIRITQTNTSDQTVDCSESDVGATDLSYSYDVRDAKGKEVKKHDLNHLPSSSRHSSSCALGSGEKLPGKYLISWLCDLSQPGKYTIRVSRNISNDPAAGVVRSNTIKITVTK